MSFGKNSKLIYIFLVALAALLCACGNSESTNTEKEQGGGLAAEEKPKVEVMLLRSGVFYKEILSNGKLIAIRKADLKFRVSEEISRINVQNGSLVEAGAVIALLNNYTYNLKLQRAKAAYEKAKVEMLDALIAFGYQTTDSSRVPVNIWKQARVRSGLDNASYDLQSAEYDYQNTVLRAPFRGVVCNLKSKEQNLANNDIFCTLIDNSTFEASFQVLESELANVSINDPVSVIPFALDSTAISGILTEINPLVDENGLVTIKAKVNNARNNLYEGMNVRVIVKKVFPNKLVVPKSAVVMRTGKEVVFTLEDGLAKWNYVKTGLENTTSFTITEGLKPGMKVITSGNLNLGHDAEVVVMNNEGMNNERMNEGMKE